LGKSIARLYSPTRYKNLKYTPSMWALRFFKTTPTVFSYKGLFPQANFAFEPHRHSQRRLYGDCRHQAGALYLKIEKT
ncbi:MAG: hypothetical protein ACM3UY_03470, partial [Methanocella sp.]